MGFSSEGKIISLSDWGNTDDSHLQRLHCISTETLVSFKAHSWMSHRKSNPTQLNSEGLTMTTTWTLWKTRSKRSFDCSVNLVSVNQQVFLPFPVALLFPQCPQQDFLWQSAQEGGCTPHQCKKQLAAKLPIILNSRKPAFIDRLVIVLSRTTAGRGQRMSDRGLYCTLSLCLPTSLPNSSTTPVMPRRFCGLKLMCGHPRHGPVATFWFFMPASWKRRPSSIWVC